MVEGEYTVYSLLEKYKDDIVMLDALNMWAMNPSWKTAGYGLDENKEKIREIIRIRYPDINHDELIKKIDEEMKLIYNHLWLKTDIEDRAGHIIKTLKDLISEKFAEKLRNEVIRRIKKLDEKEKRFVYLFSINLSSLDRLYTYRVNPKVMIDEVSARYYVSWGEEPDLDNFESVLTKVGIYNPIIKKTRSGQNIEYLIPIFLEHLVKNIDEYIVPEKPSIPKVDSYIEQLFEQRENLQLQILDILIERNGLTIKDEYIQKVKTEKLIVDEYGNYVSISPFVLEDLKKILQEKKRAIIEKLRSVVVGSLEELRKELRPYAEIIEGTENEVQFWEFEVASKTDIKKTQALHIIITPWLLLKHKDFIQKHDMNLVVNTNPSFPSITNFFKNISKNVTLVYLTEGNRFKKMTFGYGSTYKFLNKILNKVEVKLQQYQPGLVEEKVGAKVETKKVESPKNGRYFLITFPPYSDGKSLTFGRGPLANKIVWGFEQDKGLTLDSLVYTNLFDINQPHVGSFQQTRTGKSTLAACVILQVAFQGIPVLIFDPKPDYIANMIPVVRTIDKMPELKEGIMRRFNMTNQDIRGFDFSEPITFELDGKERQIEFRVYSFDKELKDLPNCKVLKLPFIVLPSIEDTDFVDQCNAIATSLSSSLSRAAGKGYNVILSDVIQKYKKQHPNEEFILYKNVIRELEAYPVKSKEDEKKVNKLIDLIKDFYTANSYLYASDEEELVKIEDIIKNPDYDFGDKKTISISVIDVSSLPQEKRNPILLNYVSQVCGRILNLVRRNKTERSIQLFTLFDEAQNYLPDPSDLYNYVRVIITRGASLGIKAWVIAQSPQAIEKEARKQFTTLILSKVNPASVRDEVSKFVQTGTWEDKLKLSELGKALVINQQTSEEGGKLCVTFTTPQTVDVLSTKQIGNILKRS